MSDTERKLRWQRLEALIEDMLNRDDVWLALDYLHEQHPGVSDAVFVRRAILALRSSANVAGKRTSC